MPVIIDTDAVPPLAPLDIRVHKSFLAAKTALDDAEAALRTAETAATSASADLADPACGKDPMASMRALRTAQASAEDLQTILPTLRLRLANAQTALRLANGETHRGRVEYARELRLRAAARRDAALAELTAAAALHARAGHYIEAAHQAGMERPFDGAYLAELRTEAAERALWAA